MIQRLQTFAWDSGLALEGLLDAVKWPFERVAWALERVVVWPLTERIGAWSASARTAGFAGLALLAAAAGAAGLLSAAGGGERPVAQAVPAETAASVSHESRPAPEATAAKPVLQGIPPNFNSGLGSAKSVTKGGAAVSAGAVPPTSPQSTPASTGDVIASTPSDKSSAPPAAAEAVHEFSSAFLLYEIGKSNDRVNSTLSASASPRLVKKLLNRPPRLPANVDVPKAKVLNVVSGPHHGKAYTFSVSLLRLGITSELRLEVEREGGEWQVTNVLG